MMWDKDLITKIIIRCLGIVVLVLGYVLGRYVNVLFAIFLGIIGYVLLFGKLRDNYEGLRVDKMYNRYFGKRYGKWQADTKAKDKNKYW